MTEKVDLYSADLPSPELHVFSHELARWKFRYQTKMEPEWPSTCADTLVNCDKDLFPNIYKYIYIYTLLQIASTIPVSSCECEHSASVLRHLRNFMRAGMTENRLTSLALMHI